MWTRKDTKILLLTGLVLLMARAKNRRFGLMIRLLLSRFSHVRLSTTPETAAHQAPLSLGFSRQEYWSGLPCPSPEHLPDSRTEPTSLMSPVLAGGFFKTRSTWEAHYTHGYYYFHYFFWIQMKLRLQQCGGPPKVWWALGIVSTVPYKRVSPTTVSVFLPSLLNNSV